MSVPGVAVRSAGKGSMRFASLGSAPEAGEGDIQWMLPKGATVQSKPDSGK